MIRKRLKKTIFIIPSQCLFFLTLTLSANTFATPFSTIDANVNQRIIKDSRTRVKHLLSQLQPYRQLDLNEQVAYLTQQLANTPYLYKGGVGESDWQPTATTYQNGAVHIDQYPVYRLDGFDCQSFVQVVMALLHSQTLSQFDTNLLKISYGAAGNPNGEIVRYFNRNHFIDGDFNPINQRNGFLKDVTALSDLSNYADTITILLSRQQWFLQQNKNLKAIVNVLNNTDGARMVQRFKTVYSHLAFPRFAAEQITIAYVPKQSLVNEPKLLDTIPTPAVVEIVRDPSKWYLGNKKIRQVIGTDLTISHLGFLYRQTFQYGDLIYRKIICHHAAGERVCAVSPVSCQKKQCQELMFAHATDAHPSGFYYYPLTNGDYTCSPNLPKSKVAYTYCNRIERLPFIDYLTGSQYGWYMRDPSYLGVNIEKLI